MPKLYEYFGLVVLFFSNEHDDIIQKWVTFFVMHRSVSPERITRRFA